MGVGCPRKRRGAWIGVLKLLFKRLSACAGCGLRERHSGITGTSSATGDVHHHAPWICGVQRMHKAFGHRGHRDSRVDLALKTACPFGDHASIDAGIVPRSVGHEVTVSRARLQGGRLVHHPRVAAA